MDKLTELLPLLIPLIAAELAVAAYTLFHIFTHKHYRRGTRFFWAAITLILMNTFVGPILYFLFGKEES